MVHTVKHEFKDTQNQMLNGVSGGYNNVELEPVVFMLFSNYLFASYDSDIIPNLVPTQILLILLIALLSHKNFQDSARMLSF
jgi:hypothetical protein